MYQKNHLIGRPDQSNSQEHSGLNAIRSSTLVNHELIDVVKGGRASAAASDMFASPEQKDEVLKCFDDGIARHEHVVRLAP
jgi:hypothetical protein